MQGRRIVDLSVTLAEDLPCWWPDHMPIQHKVFNWYADDLDGPTPLRSRAGPYQTRWLALDEHTGTHFDAPTHFIPPPGSGLPHAAELGTVSAEQVPLEQLIGPAAVIDVRDLADDEPAPGESRFVTPEVLVRWELEHGELSAPDVVLLWTGWDTRYRPGAEAGTYLQDVLVSRTRPGWPAPDVAFVETLIERGVRCLATDAPTIGAAHDGVPVHVAGLGGGLVYVEGLTGLGALPARGALFAFLPLKLRGGSGAPGRAIAWIDED